MKLEFESNAVSSPLVNNDVPAEFDTEHGSPEVLQLLRDGIKAAQDGDQAEARTLLLRVTEADPNNENAWLWLASISEYPEELLVFLNNVLDVNPGNERALEWAKATKSLIAKTFVQRGIEASKNDQKKSAKQCFLQALVHDAESELAWLWLASVTDSTEEKMAHLQKVLAINPDNENALTSLQNSKRHSAKAMLPEANAAAISGDREKAREILAEILADAPDVEDAWMLQAHISDSFDEKIAAFERVLEINPENPVARANVDSLKYFSSNNPEGENVDAPSEDHEDSTAEDDMRFSALNDSDPVTEAYNSMDSSSLDIQYQEEEVVEFEEVEVPDEDSSDSLQLFEEEDLAVQGESPQEPAQVESEGEEESFEFEEEDCSPSFSAEDGEVDHEVDHDYAAENVDASEEAGTEPQAVEFMEDNPDFTSEEIAEFEAESEFENLNAKDGDLDFDADDDELQALFDTDTEAPEQAHLDPEEAHFEEEDQESDAAAAEADDDKAEMSPEESENTENDFELQSDESEVQEMESSENDEGVDEAQELEAVQETVEPESSETPGADFQAEHAPNFKSCPFCNESNEHQAFACHGCKAIFTISDIEMILSHKKANSEIISNSLKKMESNKTLRGVDVEELKHLGIGYLNLRDFRKGFEYLQEAAKKDPSDVVLVSQIDALAIRVAEIEEHQRDHEPISKGKRILIVDDSPTVRKLISGKLEKCGHEAICAVDGMDALAKINEVIPDLILLDITMPRMDGYQVCKLIRGNDATKDVPVVMISGKDGFFDKVRGRMAGTSNYITKPFGPETLMKTINEYVQ